MKRSAAIAGVGSYLPERVMTNADWEQLVETSDEWITSRTGIKERHFVVEGQTTSDLVTEAARRAMESGGFGPDDIDQLIVATLTPDMLMPSTAAVAQAKLGLTCPAFDINAACSGFIYALQIAVSTIESGRADRIIVVGAEALSRFLDFTDRATCVLFGDGAGAVVLEATEGPGVESIILGADGSGQDLIIIPGGGATQPPSLEVLEQRTHLIKMAGTDVYKFAVKCIPRATFEVLESSEHSLEDLTWLIPHQANQRILDTVEERLGIEHAKVVSNVANVGNTSAASIPLALDDLYTSGRLSEGDLVALVGFGAGLTWGAAVVRWTMPAFKEED